MFKHFLILSCLVLLTLGKCEAQGAIAVKGVVMDSDSITPIAFALALNRNSNVGTMTDAGGRFELSARSTDTLLFSYLGYEVQKLVLRPSKDSTNSNLLHLKIVLKKKEMTLQQVIILSNGFTKEEKQYYSSKIDQYERFKHAGIESPITGLYMAFSKEGKSMKKLVALYDELLYDELLEKRLSDDKLRQLTGNEKLDCQKFREYCKLSDDFLTLASEFTLYDAVLKMYSDFASGKKSYHKVK